MNTADIAMHLIPNVARLRDIRTWKAFTSVCRSWRNEALFWARQNPYWAVEYGCHFATTLEFDPVELSKFPLNAIVIEIIAKKETPDDRLRYLVEYLKGRNEKPRLTNAQIKRILGLPISKFRDFHAGSCVLGCGRRRVIRETYLIGYIFAGVTNDELQSMLCGDRICLVNRDLVSMMINRGIPAWDVYARQGVVSIGCVHNEDIVKFYNRLKEVAQVFIDQFRMCHKCTLALGLPDWKAIHVRRS